MDNDSRKNYIQKVFANLWPGARFEKPKSGDVAFMLKRGKNRYTVRSLPVNAPRINDIKGQLAISILEIGQQKNQPNARHLLTVISPKFGQRTVDSVDSFMSRHAPNFAWALIDFQGHVRFCDPQNNESINQIVKVSTGRSAVKAAPSALGTAKLFTDLNIWMLKILTLQSLPDSYWPGPREQIANPTHLGRVAGVAVQTAHVFVKALIEHGFAEVTRLSVQILRKRRLLELLIGHAQGQGVGLTPVRSIFGSPVDWGRLKADAQDRQFAIGGLEACTRHGLRHVTGGIPWIHIEGSLEDCLRSWDLMPCADHEAQVAVAMPRYRNAIFRGYVQLDGLPVVDVLQCAMDASTQPGRGMEQAEFIIEHILEYDEAK